MEPLTSQTQQLEYYLSDQNLKVDTFFRDLIQESSEGYVEVSHFLKCNKIKKLQATEDSLISAAQKSELLEVNEARTAVRRKDNKELPDLILGKSATAGQLGGAQNGGARKSNGADVNNLKVIEKQIQSKTDEFIPLIVAIKNSDEVPKTNGKDLEDAI